MAIINIPPATERPQSLREYVGGRQSTPVLIATILLRHPASNKMEVATLRNATSIQVPARYQGAGLRPPSKRAERIPTTPVLPGLVKTQLLARESFTAKRRAHQELMIRQAAARNADDASLNCHLPHKAVSRDSVGNRACEGVHAVVAAAVGDDAGDAADGDDDLQVVRPHRLEGVLQGFLVALQ